MAGTSTGLSTQQGVGGILSIANEFEQAFEFQKQTHYEQTVLQNNSDMVKYQRDSQVRDIDARTAIMSGKAIAGAGKSGVRATGSVIAQASDIIAKAAVDKLRTNVQAQNMINLNTAKIKELSRQQKANMASTELNAGIQGVSMGLMAFGL